MHEELASTVPEEIRAQKRKVDPFIGKSAGRFTMNMSRLDVQLKYPLSAKEVAEMLVNFS